MRTGDLRRRVKIEARTSTLDQWGQQVNTWTTLLDNVPAAIELLKGTEKLVALQVQNEVTHKITVRYHSIFADPKTVGAWRVVYGARIFNIHYAANPDERNRWIEMEASEGLNDGR